MKDYFKAKIERKRLGGFGDVIEDERVSLLLENASDELKGKRASSESLVQVMPKISKLADDFETTTHMHDLRMGDDSLSKFAFHLQFDDSERHLSQMAHIKRVEEYVINEAPNWANDVTANRTSEKIQEKFVSQLDVV